MFIYLSKEKWIIFTAFFSNDDTVASVFVTLRMALSLWFLIFRIHLL